MCFTGTLTTKRADATKMAEAAGAIVDKSFKKATEILVCGASVGAAKTSKALKQGAEIWNESEFLEALSSGGGGKKAKKKKAPVKKKPAAKKKAPAKPKKRKAKSKGKLNGLNICFTGTMPVKRSVVEELLESLGGIPNKTVKKATEVLVTGEGVGAKKINDALKKGVEIMSFDDFLSNAANDGANLDQYGLGAPQLSEEGEDEDDKPPAKKKAAVVSKKKKAVKKEAKKEVVVAKKKAIAAASSSGGGGGGGRRVMSCVTGNFSVVDDYDVKLMLSNQTTGNNNKFYKIQLLQEGDGSYHVVTNWGRLGEPGRNKVADCPSLDSAIALFCKTYRSKTKNVWGEPFVRHNDKYQVGTSCWNSKLRQRLFFCLSVG